MTTYAAIGGMVLVLLFIVWIAFRSAERKGRADAERDRFQAASEAARRANEIDEDVMRLPDDELDRELFDRR